MMIDYFGGLDMSLFKKIIVFRKDADIGTDYKPEEMEEFKEYFKIKQYNEFSKRNILVIIPKTNISSIKLIFKED